MKNDEPRRFVELNERPTVTDDPELDKLIKQVSFYQNHDEDERIFDIFAGTRNLAKYQTLLGQN